MPRVARLQAALGRTNRHGTQRGAATLVVVMVLFFVMAMVAAYSSRNIVFEQRTSANFYTANAAFEAAEAGLEWAMSMLNGPRTTSACAASTVTTDPSFRQRYLRIDAANGAVTMPVVGERLPPAVCWYDQVNNRWTCHCPIDVTTPGSIASTPTDSFVPSFRVRFAEIASPDSRPGAVRVEVMGCTRWSFTDDCLNFYDSRPATDCRGTVCATVALASALKSPPVAAVTARGSINAGGGATLGAYNASSGTAGLTVLAGGTVNTTGLQLQGPPGVPSSVTFRQLDPPLADAAFTAPRMFASLFGAWPASYLEHPGAVRMACGTPCSSTDLRNAISFNPGRMLIAEGDVAFDGGSIVAGTSIGTEAAPVALVVTGNVTFTSATDVVGLVYVRAANWATSGAGTIRGASVAESNITGTGAFTTVFDQPVLERLRWTTGSFVKVPGGWKDFQ